MKQITDFVKKIPKPYYENQFGYRNVVDDAAKIPFSFTILFVFFYVLGINVFFTRNLFVFSLLIKIIWLIILLTNLYNSTYNFAEGFIFYSICAMYLLHFFDIFLLFFFVIFVPNGKMLLEE